MVTATGSIRASGAHAATTPTRPKTIRPQPDAHETSPCSRAFSSASLMHLCSGKRCNLAPALTRRGEFRRQARPREGVRHPPQDATQNVAVGLDFGFPAPILALYKQ